MMRDEIAKIVAMTKAGTITEEQATELLQALTEGAKEEPPTPPMSDAEPFVHGGSLDDEDDDDEDEGNNSIFMSNVDRPEGNGAFVHNSIKLSSLSGIQLNKSRFYDTSINASRLKDLRLNDASISDCSFNGSSIEDLSLAASKIHDASFNGSRMTRIAMEKAWIHDFSLNGSNLKEVAFTQGTNIRDCRIQGSNFVGVRFENVQLADFAIEASSWSRVTIRNVDLKDEAARLVNLSDVEIDGNEAFLAAIKGAKKKKW